MAAHRRSAGAEVTARNVGSDAAPLGLGFHPYFNLPSGERRQARLRLPARLRAEVDDYDQVLPTGVLSEVAGGPFDFNGESGAPLAGTYLDDCFTDLAREDGEVVVEVLDPAAGVGLRITSPTPQVKAVQVYAPPDKAFVVVEPQFNLADPFSPVWPVGVDTGVAVLKPGEELPYEVRVAAFALGT
jgi:galactose mutarotase-like enzyme